MELREEILNNYAVEKGYVNWKYLQTESYPHELYEHINKVIELIQKELLKKVSENAEKQVWQVLKNDVKNAILNTEII